MGNIQKAFWVAMLAAQVLLIAALISRGFVRRVPFFTIYLAWEVISGIVLIQIDYRTIAYAEAFKIYAAVVFVLLLGVAAELFEWVCRYFRGIGSFRFLIAGTGLSLSSFFAISTFRPDVGRLMHFPHGLAEVMARWESEILAGLFVFTWLFFRITVAHEPRFESALRRHWAIFTAYLLISSSARLGAILTGGNAETMEPINTAMLAGDLVCVFLWIKSMKPAAVESLPVVSIEEMNLASQRGQELLSTARHVAEQIRKR